MYSSFLVDKKIGPHKLKRAICKKNCSIAVLVAAPESPVDKVDGSLTYVAAATQLVATVSSSAIELPVRFEELGGGDEDRRSCGA